MPSHTNSRPCEETKPESPYENAEPQSPSIRIGRRPTLSDKPPHIGANRNCMAENEAISRPSCILLALNHAAYLGSSGRTIPKPSRSIKTVRKTIISVALLTDDTAGFAAGSALDTIRSFRTSRVQNAPASGRVLTLRAQRVGSEGARPAARRNDPTAS